MTKEEKIEALHKEKSNVLWKMHEMGIQIVISHPKCKKMFSTLGSYESAATIFFSPYTKDELTPETEIILDYFKLVLETRDLIIEK